MRGEPFRQVPLGADERLAKQEFFAVTHGTLQLQYPESNAEERDTREHVAKERCKSCVRDEMDIIFSIQTVSEF